jgi:hypothetical protein
VIGAVFRCKVRAVSERTRIFASVTVAVACAGGAVAAVQGCTLKNCDGTSYWYDDHPDQTTSQFLHLPLIGHQLDEWTWESGPILQHTDDDNWLEFPGQRFVQLFPNGKDRDIGAGPFPGPYDEVLAYVSSDPEANAVGNNWTLASGNLAEITVHEPEPYNDAGTGDHDWFVTVHNDTCAPYYLRVVVRRATPSVADAGSVDAGVSDAPGAD